MRMGRRQVVGIRPRTGLSSAQANAAFRIILFLYYQIQAHDPGRAVLLHLAEIPFHSWMTVE